MDLNNIPFSVVEYLRDHSGYQCGYCKSPDTNYSHGMWAHRMNVLSYRHLIHRGWRRSGKYLYKPTMGKTCCPQYTIIRCDAENFQLSKSQKKVLKRMHAFLSNGAKEKTSDTGKSEGELCLSMEQVECPFEPKGSIANTSDILMKDLTKASSGSVEKKSTPPSSAQNSHKPSNSRPNPPPPVANEQSKAGATPGVGQDPSKPLCKKAKILRMERRAAKLKASGVTPNILTSPKKTSNEPKSLEDFINSPLPEHPAHKLEFRLVPVSFKDTEFSKTFPEAFELFRKYQMSVHKDPPEECDEKSFKNFLVDGPLSPYKGAGSPPKGFGPFHYQYWLDGELIAVGVLDILPGCVSSVYFYYDPKYSFLSLGTYSSLREIALTQELKGNSELHWLYYMGFYIHSCPKMRYKKQYTPSYLLCPETYRWVPIEECLPKLDVSKYSRLYDSYVRKEVLDINKVPCLYNSEKIFYGELRFLTGSKEMDEVTEYLNFVGEEAANTMLLAIIH
ncbi:Arginyl-tRNA--protein transferase 1 [Armadillidium nasatum]|uniref:Arginyl-tRNA--protein transferase 1 n=1 Tax=Armadillidium nasatum TaxID=96803 RepID=A0A5N5T1E7_9CRUS|nr:Arginyl-tRNA--protein transferase 1 [Armadillidium nasatum]